METIYHVFTNSRDEFVKDIAIARSLYRHFKKVYGTARMYIEVEDAEGEMISEDCLASFGPYPW